MPWTGKEFASRHNHGLSGARANKAARQANAVLRSGIPEGEAIAIANKHAMKGSPKSREEHMGRVTEHQSQKSTGKDFGVSQSTVSRKTMKRGFTPGGSAAT